ncbi:phage tail sheath subtilisin-like domain-containing protein [Fulvivirga maritima]|uniref:phage tail sheath family protein n=1 Tax=Fulvivirga maritima TaxID=2904247 RepID=UPI001F30EBEE|nr:phage tail sheath C-terminal domain-containing protein [Fulvivirga maritima]UII24670.1 phage tail sheath subtilisin-like domain-containing protein [Fulvivirga maritima]
MPSYQTPGVYTEEVPTLPPSVAEVSTAIPAFIGFTERASKAGKDVFNTAVRISTMLEYKEIFGGADPTIFTVDLNADESIKEIAPQVPVNTLYYALDLYFKNGGGACYVISTGNYEATFEKSVFIDALTTLSKEDEPTLIMLGEATKLEQVDYYEVCRQALAQCANLKDRFCIFDVLSIDVDAQSFRDNIGINNLKYGAAYTPYLHTSLSYMYKEEAVSINGLSGIEKPGYKINGINIMYSGDISDQPKFRINQSQGAGNSSNDVTFDVSDSQLTIRNVGDGVPAQELVNSWLNHNEKGLFEIVDISNGTEKVESTGELVFLEASEPNSITLADIKSTKSALYNKLVSELSKWRVVLPPSPAVAGVYAVTDRTRGVWKAPANISLNAVIGPVEKITTADQEKLNIDSEAGKSINAIRSFSGKGTLIWGARTLAGNDNEWRYVPVRRLFNMIEESTQKASHFAVFEPNDAATWLKVKAMIDSYLYGIWQQGALAGSTPEQAYYVNIGLGKTMTQQDILEGRMIVEIGVAAVRPVEFIVLRFSHKLQES